MLLSPFSKKMEVSQVKKQMKTLWETILQKKAYTLIAILLVCILSGSFIFASTQDNSSVQVSSLKKEVMSKSDEIDSLKKDIESLDNKVVKLKKAKTDLTNELKNYQSEKTHLKKLNQKVILLQKKNENADEHNSKLKKKLAVLTQQVKELKQQKSPSDNGSHNNTAQSKDDTKEVMVHITDTGTKYHCAGCSYLRESDYEISLSEAEERGYTPCSRCY